MKVPVLSATVPSPLDCVVSPVNWQQLAELLYVNLPDSTTQINFGSLTPPPSQRGNPWIATFTDGTPATPVWVYTNGFWLLPHPAVDPVSGVVDTDRLMFWKGPDVQATIDALDGGESGAVTDFSGPMWTKFLAIGAHFPIATGTLPSGKIINVGDTGGEETHALKLEELPATTAKTSFNYAQADGDFSPIGTTGDLLGSTNPPDATKPVNTFTASPVGGDANGVTVPHNNIPPYYGLIVLQKTGRRFYRRPG